MFLAEFNPTILFLLLWGLLSWLTKKKKVQLKEKDQGEHSEMDPKENLFLRLQKLQDHLSKEVEIFPSAPVTMETEEEYFNEDNEYGLEEPKILETGPEDVHESEGYVFARDDTKIPTKSSDSWMKQNLSSKSELRKLIVLKAILGEPRSLKPYTGDYFHS